MYTYIILCAHVIAKHICPDGRGYSLQAQGP